MSARAWLTCCAVFVGLVSAVSLRPTYAEPARTDSASAPDAAARAPDAATAPDAARAPGAAADDPSTDDQVHAAPPPFTEGIFPCTQCHEGGGDGTRRELAFHEDIKLRHAPTHWCVDCHDLENRDVLHLAGGEPVPFTESYRLCAQCHFDKHRDWRLGIHGKRVGQWNGQKTALLCVNCHNPHAPRFGTLKPQPRPSRPEEMGR